jgi:hypothetical protein
VSDSFRFIALPAERFAPLFDRSNAALQEIGVRRMVVTEKPGFPCRVSLVDAELGETVLLVPFVHHDTSCPYRSSGPIFVRRGALTANPAVGEVPEMLRHRTLSIRAYDEVGMMTGAAVVKGGELEEAMRRLFADESVGYLHIHNAGPGCYNCRVERA